MFGRVPNLSPKEEEGDDGGSIPHKKSYYGVRLDEIFISTASIPAWQVEHDERTSR